MPVEIVTQLPALSVRAADSNKGTFGRVLVVAGSRGMSGAAILCGSAALRTGAGLVQVATPRELWPIVAAGNPCYMTVPLPEDAEGRLGEESLPELLRAASLSDVMALGPGLGRSPGLTGVVRELLTQLHIPIVLDADGLNACVGQTETLGKHTGPVVITPHPGEFGRLLGVEASAVQANRRELAINFARQFRLVVLLKGQRTLVTDGDRLYENATGNPGMATAGSGDVLTGLVAALIGQGLAPFAAAQLGAHLHGLAGDLARTDLGEEGMIATDLVDYLPRAFLEWRERPAIV